MKPTASTITDERANGVKNRKIALEKSNLSTLICNSGVGFFYHVDLEKCYFVHQKSITLGSIFIF